MYIQENRILARVGDKGRWNTEKEHQQRFKYIQITKVTIEEFNWDKYQI